MAVQSVRVYKTGTHATIAFETIEKDSATVIPKKSFVALDAGGLAIPADETSTQIAYTEEGAEAGTTSVDVHVDSEVLYRMDSDAAFAKTNRSTEVDIIIDGSGKQLIDLDASTTDVLKVMPQNGPEKVGELTDLIVKVNKPLS